MPTHGLRGAERDGLVGGEHGEQEAEGGVVPGGESKAEPVRAEASCEREVRGCREEGHELQMPTPPRLDGVEGDGLGGLGEQEGEDVVHTVTVLHPGADGICNATSSIAHAASALSGLVMLDTNWSPEAE